MRHRKDITPYNDKYQRHGRWVQHYSTGDMMHTSTYVNGVTVGYYELRPPSNHIHKEFYII